MYEVADEAKVHCKLSGSNMSNYLACGSTIAPTLLSHKKFARFFRRTKHFNAVQRNTSACSKCENLFDALSKFSFHRNPIFQKVGCSYISYCTKGHRIWVRYWEDNIVVSIFVAILVLLVLLVILEDVVVLSSEVVSSNNIPNVSKNSQWKVSEREQS